MAVTTFSLDRSQLESVTGKTVLITGAASGIGLSTASLLHSLGNNVISLDLQGPRQTPGGVDIGSLIHSSRYLHVPTDVTSWIAQRSAFEQGLAKFGRIDAVFVNAGIAEYEEQFFNEMLDGSGKLSEPDRRTLTIDLDAATFTVRLAIWALRKNKADGGSIVMIASLAGYLASAGAGNYSAAKHGIVGLMRALKNDTAKHHIAISVVAPGMTVTPIVKQERGLSSEAEIESFVRRMKEAGVPWNRPETVAFAVVYLIGLGIKANGAGLLIQNDRLTDVEAGLAKNRSQWMGEEQLRLFKGGRAAPLFPNKL